MITLHQIEQGSEPWHQLRVEFPFTGTSAEKLLRFGAIDYTANKPGNAFKGNFWTKRGHILEDEAIGLYQQITKSTGIRFDNGDKVGFVTNSKYPLCGYSPDDLYPDRTIEVKCFDAPNHLAMFNGVIPLKVLAQIHYGLFLCEKPLAHLVIYNPTLEAKLAYKVIPIKAQRAINNNFKKILSQLVKPLEEAVN